MGMVAGVVGLVRECLGYIDGVCGSTVVCSGRQDVLNGLVKDCWKWSGEAKVWKRGRSGLLWARRAVRREDCCLAIG